jgi:hypothetical protein
MILCVSSFFSRPSEIRCAVTIVTRLNKFHIQLVKNLTGQAGQAPVKSAERFSEEKFNGAGLLSGLPLRDLLRLPQDRLGRTKNVIASRVWDVDLNCFFRCSKR